VRDGALIARRTLERDPRDWIQSQNRAPALSKRAPARPATVRVSAPPNPRGSSRFRAFGCTLRHAVIQSIAMAYRATELAVQAEAMIRREPRISLSALAEKLGVHRHTVASALSRAGMTFFALRKGEVLRRMAVWADSPTPAPLKQLWGDMGFSSASSFARYVRKATGRSPAAATAGRSLDQWRPNWPK